MPRYIVHREGAYNLFTTISDTFLFEPALTLESLSIWYRSEHGEAGMVDLPPRLERAQKNGSSGLPPFDGLDWLLNSNREGEGEAGLSQEECVKRFLTLPTTNE